jgi:hypothetical protein
VKQGHVDGSMFARIDREPGRLRLPHLEYVATLRCWCEALFGRRETFNVKQANWGHANENHNIVVTKFCSPPGFGIEGGDARQ